MDFQNERTTRDFQSGKTSVRRQTNEYLLCDVTYVNCRILVAMCTLIIIQYMSAEISLFVDKIKRDNRAVCVHVKKKNNRGTVHGCEVLSEEILRDREALPP